MRLPWDLAFGVLNFHFGAPPTQLANTALKVGISSIGFSIDEVEVGLHPNHPR